jgi:hypothetical protein
MRMEMKKREFEKERCDVKFSLIGKMGEFMKSAEFLFLPCFHFFNL